MKPGDVVRYWSKRGGWYTGVFNRVVERGKKFGLYEIKPVINTRSVYKRPEEVKAWEKK
jgi:hypothetical protein